MKAIIINSCRECPYAECGAWGGECSKFGQMPISTSDNREDWPDTIHPDCKLNDVPSVEDAVSAVNIPMIGHEEHFCKLGANFVIDKLTK